MSGKLRFRWSVTSFVAPGEGVFLLSERKQTVLRGALVECLAPLLAEGRTRESITTALSDRFAPEQVTRALDRLLASCHVIETGSPEAPGTAAFWELAGLDGTAATRTAAGSVEINALGSASTAPFAQAAAEAGIRVRDRDGDLAMVLTDDYLDPALESVNRCSLERGRPWLLVRPSGARIWIGPLFQPGRTGCWHCLSVRLRGNRMVDSFVQSALSLERIPVTGTATGPGVAEIAGRLAALQAAKWLAGVRSEDLSEVFTLDTVTLEGERHRLTRRPQCPVCGDPGIQTEAALRPVVFRAQQKAGTTDGGHRARDPEGFVASYGHHVSPVTGIVPELVRFDSRTVDTDGAGLLHSYVAGFNTAVHQGGFKALRSSLRSMSGGKGRSDVQARASALGEAVERYSAIFQGDEPRRVASYRELGPEQAIHPSALQLYSARQYAERETWNSRTSGFHHVWRPLDEDARVEWTPVWSLTRGRHVHVPTAYLYFEHPESADGFAGGDSNGCAAGTSPEDAALQGFMELVERDGVALWWYNRVRRPAVDLSSFDDPYFVRWQAAYRRMDRQTWVLDLTSDLGIPTVVALARRTTGPAEEILMGFGAHFDMRIAISRAMTEVNQFLPHVGASSGRPGGYRFDEPDYVRWWTTATLANQPYLQPLDGPPRTSDTCPVHVDRDLLADLKAAQLAVERAGLEMLVLDQTRVDVGLPVVKVLVPGLRHFWPRYAPGRLYEVPVALGWLREPTPEEDLNPIGVFL
ncbi:TOMM precursor leader peptide-binding protein [Streptomyces rectiverticillatus]|uniref:TOMM precursor leader peptide-binding protein n=1 Tax=Streptomyces rectiverticillatus TaxID=173860 RepID=UPI0015C35A12|nr:TOMM precursor leader peptide-binding protein [Streptomyces rectiverticillatus]QLE70285.1 TOMM precursor leader peptide-binding protein [Streptomyces rectiverticillatus]